MFHFELKDNGVIKGLTTLAGNINPAMKRGIKQFMARLRHKMRSEAGDRITYPVKWDSEKQRRAFFATNGFGKGIPYKRTGQTVWTVNSSFTNEVDLFAPHPAGPVFGLMPNGDWWQSRIHSGTWPILKKVLYEEIAKLPADILKSLKTLFRENPL